MEFLANVATMGKKRYNDGTEEIIQTQMLQGYMLKLK
jgi:hypothetical protein